MISAEKTINRALSGIRLTVNETAALLEIENESDLELLYNAADSLRDNLCGNQVTYVKNRNINFTNICMNNCSFCAFRSNNYSSNAYTLTIEELVGKINPADITEVCIQGGLNNALSSDYYLNILSAIKDKFPTVHIHAFSPMEVKFMAEKSGYSVGDMLHILKEKGLGSMPGTAAEILCDDIRQIICPEKLSTEKWIETIKSAHRTGIPTTATIMFGHIERTEHIARHLSILRDIQEDTGGFTEFIPLPFISKNTELARNFNIFQNNLILTYKLFAVSRLYFGKVLSNIQASWVKIGTEGVRNALHYGVNDVGGTLGEERISKAAGACHGETISEETLRQLIISAGRSPIQRDTLYRILEKDKTKTVSSHFQK